MAINDTFTYSNGNLSGQSAWSTTAFDGTLAVSTNQVANTLGSTRGNVRTDNWNSAQSSQIQYITGGGFPGVLIHANTGGASFNGYSFGVDLATNDCYLEIRTSGAGTTLDLGNAPSFGPNSTIRIAREGNDVVGYIDGVEVARATNTTYTGGKPGIFAFTDGSIVLDNWTGTGEGASLNHYTITAEGGSYSYAGQSATLVAGNQMTAEQGTYVLLGSEALRDIELDAAQGSYSLNGQETGTLAPRELTADSGSYQLNGPSVNFIYSAVMVVTEELIRNKRRMSAGRGFPFLGRF